MDIHYIGEHLTAGNLGYFSVALAFGAALWAFIAYLIQTIQDKKNKADAAVGSYWRNFARIGFLLHGIGVLGIVLFLYFIIQQHYFEFHYVWAHSSMDLPVKYMISCFWEGQEGSFLLWLFWHVIIGIVVIFTSRKWESPVMISIMLAQIMLSSMLLGLEFWGMKIGSNPFILLRNALEAPIFSQPEYLSKIVDGTGLNLLLQNYWMVIHPPVLFLGFAATIVPFAYAMAGLITGKLGEWIKPSLPWTLFTVGILGLGILMGGAWAYEALSFGGFWAWDPVENAVLVPWLLIVAALHVQLIYKFRGTALLSSFLMVMSGFILILYSTFLTRSGILGNASVHSFTDLGLSGQLILFLVLFVVASAVLVLIRIKQIPKSKSEENLTSREFWMFIGAIILLFSAFQVIFSTSIPVFNAIFNASIFDIFFPEEVKMAPPADPISHYNKFQIPFAILIAFLTSIGQFFKYRQTSLRAFFKQIAVTFLISLIITTIVAVITGMNQFWYLLLLLGSVFAVIGNFVILWPYIKTRKKLSFSGASIAHIGIGFILFGALISNARREILSNNQMGYDYGDNYSMKDKLENIYLPKNQPVMMGEYLVTYLSDSIVGEDSYYKVEYKKVDFENNKVKEKFYLYPNGQINEEMGGFIARPSTKHYLMKDIYTHITSVDAETAKKGDFDSPVNFTVKENESFEYEGYQFNVGILNLKPELPKEVAELEGMISTSLTINVANGELEETANPLFLIHGSQLIRPPFDLTKLPFRIYFAGINTETREYDLAVCKASDTSPKFIIMKAMTFPFINFLWLGSVLLTIGSLLAMYHRIKEQQKIGS